MHTQYDFHPGERAVQLKAGTRASAERVKAIVADTIIEGAIHFVEKQFMVVIASIDKTGAAWSSLVYGEAGFARVTQTNSVAIHMPNHLRDDADPLWHNLVAGSSIGLLFIELATRRRYRVNGRLLGNDDKGIEISVDEAFPNCPKYIQRRQLKRIGAGDVDSKALTGAALNAQIKTILEKADTLFLASSNARSGADSSHRGGHSGFVKVLDDYTLLIPDYSGNNIFNTLGNIELNANAGLCVPDFTGKQLLQLTGKASILWDQTDPLDFTGGTHRFVKFVIDGWILRQASQHLEWEYVENQHSMYPSNSLNSQS